MPAISKRKRLLLDLDDHARHVQRSRLEKQLQDEFSSNSDDLSDIDLGPLHGDDLDTFNIDLLVNNLQDELNAELELLKLELESELMDLGENMDMDDLPSPTSSDISDGMHERWSQRVEELAHHIQTTRVLDPEPPNPKSSQMHLLDHWRDHNMRSFRMKLRVHPTTFDHLLDLIKDHPIFQNSSNMPQHPVSIQFAIFLVRAGHYGNASSVAEVALWAGVSVGLVRKATLRVMVALLSLHDKAIHLPNEEEKELSKTWAEVSVCPEWRGGYLTADGTKFAFFERPGLHGDAWFDKNKDYSADCQVVNLLHNLLIVDYGLGHTGSVHDSWAFRSTRTLKEHDKIFGDGEWLWADSAYPCETWTACPFKKPIGGDLTKDQKTYNYHVSKIRIRSEHAIGLLKGTFQSLKELRIQITDKDRHLEMIMWCRCCIILHNLIIRIEEGTGVDNNWREAMIREGLTLTARQQANRSETHQGQQNAGEGPEDIPDVDDGHPGLRFREQLMDKLFDSPFTTAQRRPD